MASQNKTITSINEALYTYLSMAKQSLVKSQMFELTHLIIIFIQAVLTKKNWSLLAGIELY